MLALLFTSCAAVALLLLSVAFFLVQVRRLLFSTCVTLGGPLSAPVRLAQHVCTV